ncbi:NAD-dependent epimerase/dehydratase [Pseudogulbenkiania sp. NH8B]|uniref:complex I NDUFA9 subunit family protein n=1 Tax=Pseudogulbenkiania sp. (strain NH8B) TaxID=748280 RepID=UPI0002279E01|nr:complex I NDUFA9 subunit family protein [Pseudogulbenkiania sp. NH8B]BAK77110.1 NAD-dependent epimerase/dehydratase [Pseudogulbenkiania sp. NH8B]
MKYQRICVIGGSGFIGGYLGERLAEAGVEITFATRNYEQHKEKLIVLPKTELVEVDVHDQTSLNALLHGHDAVVSMVGILHGSRQAFERAHVALPEKIIQACRYNGIRRLIHISALGADPNGPSHYQQTKGIAEQRIEASGLDWTILRPSVVFGRGDSFLTLFAHLARTLPVLPLAGADTRFQPVWADDVARAMVACLANDATVHHKIELAGTKVYALRELVRYVAGLSGQQPLIIGLPAGLAMLQAGLMELLPGQPLMSRDNVRSLSVDNVGTGPFPRELLGFSPTALEAIAPLYLGKAEPNEVRSHFRTEAGR